MRDKQQEELKLKMVDYRRFSFIFFFLGAFVHLGAMLPLAGRTEIRTVFYYVVAMALYGLALFFYWSTRQLKDQLEEEEEL